MTGMEYNHKKVCAANKKYMTLYKKE